MSRGYPFVRMSGDNIEVHFDLMKTFGFCGFLAILGALIGGHAANGAISGLISGALYGFLAGLFAIVGILPIAGLVIYWELLKWLKTMIPLANEQLFVVVDAIGFIYAGFLTVLGTLVLLAILRS